MKYDFGFIGAGNMGGTLLKAVAEKLGGKRLAVCDRHPEKIKTTVDVYGVSAVSAKEIALNSRFIVMGVKPQVMDFALNEISEELKLNEKAVIISMAAGLSTDSIEKMSGGNRAVIRIMPNTPCAVKEGLILYTFNNLTSIEAVNEFVNAFSLSGSLDKIDEDKIDAAAALSGCGPAFVYSFAEALVEGAVECGLSKEKAVLYASKVISGAGKMIEEYGNISQLRDNVCSPGGTTIEGVRALEKGDLNGVTKSAVKASYEKTFKLKI